MANWRETLREQTLKITQFFKDLTEIQKLLIFTGLALVLLVGWSVRSLWTVDHSEVPLFQGLTPDDQRGILTFFSESGYKNYRLEGNILYVPAPDVPDLRMKLAERGLPAEGSGVGWERFDQNNFLLSDFEQRIQKVRSLQGELSRTINQLEPVLGSRVHLVIPDKSPFLQDTQKPSASIYLKVAPGRRLSESQIRGIQHLVAKAVEGLETQNIVVVDQNGTILNRDEQNVLGNLTEAQAAYQARVEEDLENKIQSILSRVVGLGKVIAKVRANIDFSQREIKQEEVDPEKRAVISSNRTKHHSTGGGLNPTGVPGTKSNVPGEREDLNTAPGIMQTQDESSEILNYEVSKTWTTRTDPVGTIQNVSVAVLVDGKIVDGVYQPRTDSEMQQIQELVKNAVGFSQERGDQITVQNAQFQMDPIEQDLNALAAAEQQKKQQRLIWTVLGILASLGFVFGVVRPYLRWLLQSPDKPVPAYFPHMDLEQVWKYNNQDKNVLQNISDQLGDKNFDMMSDIERVTYIAAQEPVRAADALKKILSGQKASS